MNKDLIGNLAWGGGIVLLALASTWARSQGYIDSDMVNRIVIGAVGLMVAWQGNRIPKAIARTAAAGRAQRVAGWSMAISGLIYAGLWIFAPTEVAVIGGCGAILAGIFITIGYCLSQRRKATPGF